MYVFCHCVFSRWGHMHCVSFSVSQSSTCFVFSLVGLLVNIKAFFLHLDPDPVLPRCLLSPFRDRIPTARMGPAGKLLNVRQGDRRIEDYARDFIGVARQSAMEKACLMIIFWGGLAESFRSRMPCWVPEESLEDYINLALNLCGSAFRVESASEPAPFREPTESTPFRVPTESAHKAREAAAVSAYGSPALRAPPWHPCLPLSPGPLPRHGT